MDIVTTLVAMAMGATLAAVFSSLLAFIKDFSSGRANEARIIIKKGHRTTEVLSATNEEVEIFLQEFKRFHHNGTHKETVSDGKAQP
jgi:hypothetical protein